MGKRQADYAASDGKRGRKEVRRIKRSGFKENNVQQLSPQIEEPLDKPETLTTATRENEFDESERKEKVYGALLTILNSEHPEPRKSPKPASTQVAELESEPEIQSDSQDEGQIEDISDDDEDESDPFESHFSNVQEQIITQLHTCFKNRQVKYKTTKTRVSDDEETIYSKPAPISHFDRLTVEMPLKKSSLSSYFLKKRLKLHNNLMESADLTVLQKKLVDPMFQYKDILYEYGNYQKDENEYRSLYSLHVLNHIYKTRDRILKNNQKLQDNTDAEYLDQGFTRPKILIVVPTRDTAYEVLNTIIEKSGLEQVDKKGKFKDQFYEDALPAPSKPSSFRHIFKGNTNDFFILGVKFTRKSIKLYSNFYQSDLILCSPLGLQMIIENTDKKKRQDDFLSSIEMMIIDQLHSIEYQNIAHVFTIFDHINKIPKEQHDTDFSRIRMWYINDQAALFRQTMIFTKYISPTANAIINNRCRNWEGRWKNHKIVSPELSSIGQLALKIRQIFQRFDIAAGSIADEPTYRFKFFTSVIIPSMVKSAGYEDGILLYIPDYTDYIRIRNYMKDHTTILFGDINEYSDQRQLTANRALFQQGRIKVLLYTERLHHYRRYEIKGVKTVIFYKPPTNPEFYNEVVRFIAKNAFLGNTDMNISTVRCLYSKLDGLLLDRITGSKRAAVLCYGQNEVYEFK